ncbi:FAD:protein FMN transferase [Pseudophaeobacter sp.]|uniref:FAD:protein FMN transferase n=1 Tax=Pseudophaeobacter sp. TaxID=1971739 RepID=UPI004058DA79
MTAPLSRRRFLSICAATVAAGPAAAASQTSAKWQGRAMGAPAQMVISGLDTQSAAPIFARLEAEIERLEQIFSLFHPQSQLSLLNTQGRLVAPAPELLDVLSLSASLNAASGGAFDPTVQPLWRALALGSKTRPLPIGWRHVSFDSAEVRLLRPGMALTLNGIAQGYITDQIADLLRAEGLRDVLLDMGEVAARGQRSDGSAWHVGVAAPDGELRAKLSLSDRALATSAAAGTQVGEGLSHILDPRSGTGAELSRLASVSAPRAALADALSTALCLIPATQAPALIRQFSGARLEYLA